MTTRAIHTKIWSDTWFAELSTSEKLLFIYLLTNRYVNLCGIYELPDRIIAFDTGLPLKTIEAAKAKLSEKIIFIDEWVAIKNVEKYDTYSGGKLSSAKEKQLQEIPHHILSMVEKIKKEKVDGVSIGYAYPMDTSNSNSNNNNNNKEGGVGETKEIETFISSFNKSFGTEYKITDTRIQKLRKRRETYSFEQILSSLSNLAKSKWHKGDNEKGWVADPDFLLRNDEQIDKFLNYKPVQPKKEQPQGIFAQIVQHERERGLL